MILLLHQVPTALFWRTHTSTLNFVRDTAPNSFRKVVANRFTGRKPLILHLKMEKPRQMFALGAV
jgi:hypothetical protein